MFGALTTHTHTRFLDFLSKSFIGDFRLPGSIGHHLLDLNSYGDSTDATARKGSWFLRLTVADCVAGDVARQWIENRNKGKEV